MSKKKALFLIDGVHKPDNTLYSLKELCRQRDVEVEALMWIGGTEKIVSRESFSGKFEKDLGRKVIFPSSEDKDGAEDALRSLLREKKDIKAVIQLSGAPQIFRERTLEFARISVSLGASYIAGGTVFSEQRISLEHNKPSIGLYATNKRVGKTAFGSYVAGLICGIKGLETPWKPVLITHSRGGPPDPPLIEIYREGSSKKTEELTLNELLSSRFKPRYLSRLLDFNLHGASDVFEDALIISSYLDLIQEEGKEVPYISLIGCRRAGAGYFNEFAVSNVKLGVKKANSIPANLVIHEGSGAEHPPVAVQGVVFLVPSDINPTELKNFPGLEKSILFIIANCQNESSTPEKVREIKKAIREKNLNSPVLLTRFEPEAIQKENNLKGKKVFLLTTAPGYILERLSSQIQKKYGARVTGAANSLDRDEDMKKDIDRAVKDDRPDKLLIEIKARGVEGAGYAWKKYGIDCCYINNVPVEVNNDFSAAPSNKRLDRAIVQSVNEAVKKFNSAAGRRFPLIK